MNLEEVKAEFEKLIKQLDTYVPMNLEATKESLKRFCEELQTKTAKNSSLDDKSSTNIVMNTREIADTASEKDDSTSGTKVPINPIPVAIKSPRVHCLNLESVDIYVLIERKYPFSAEVCKAMLDKKLQGGNHIRIATNF
ncbi:hypothetical protein Tco_0483342 [Tanacetum coccineum]